MNHSESSPALESFLSEVGPSEAFEVLSALLPDAAQLEAARQIVLLLEGCQSLMLIHGDTSYAETAAAVAKALVSARSEVDQVARRGLTGRDRRSPVRSG